MFTRSFLLFALPLIAAATAIPPQSQCNAGQFHCCESVQKAGSSDVTKALGPLALLLPSLNGNAGLTCSPLSLVDVLRNSCTEQTVCCTGNNFNGLVVLGCSPINL